MENNKKHSIENITDSDIDKLTKKLFEDVELENPSVDFTKNLMREIKTPTNHMLTMSPYWIPNTKKKNSDGK